MKIYTFFDRLSRSSIDKVILSEVSIQALERGNGLKMKAIS